jgi:hypothetical protein
MKTPNGLVINLFPLKAENGMFYYGLDYIKALGSPDSVICRRGMAKAVQDAFPDTRVLSGGLLSSCLRLYRSAIRGAFIYCPTPHPLPFIRRQFVVLHDLYPFLHGHLHRLKAPLLQIALKSSKFMVGYINRSECLPYLNRLGLQPNRLLFVPNLIEWPQRPSESPISSAKGQTVVGLLGTDSPKKRYEELFREVIRLGLQEKLRFRVFGFRSSYIDGILEQFPTIQLALVNSSKHSMQDFIASVHALVSLSPEEGFGRPLALAVLLGMPVFMPKCPLAEEFYSGFATQFEAMDRLALLLASGRIKTESPHSPRKFYDSLKIPFRDAVGVLGLQIHGN